MALDGTPGRDTEAADELELKEATNLSTPLFNELACVVFPLEELVFDVTLTCWTCTCARTAALAITLCR